MLKSNQLGNLSDRDLLAESRAYETKITADAANFNFTAAEGTEVKGVNDTFESLLDQWDAIQLQEAGIVTGKNTARTNLLAKLRARRNRLYADTSLDEATLASANLPPRDKIKTDAPAPSTAPIGWVDYGKLKHIIRFRDSATPDKKAKPDGMRGCEIWYFIGDDPPTSEDDYAYLATDSSTPYTVMYEMKDAGKTVFYQLRWLSNSGERGEWSDTIEATING